MMARPKKTEHITWLGEDDLHEDGHGPSKTAWNGITFPKGEPVEVSDPNMVRKAIANRFYAVEGFVKPEPEAEAG